MQWEIENRWRWRRSFALFPQRVSKTKTIWLEWYEWRYRPGGLDYYEEYREIGSSESIIFDTYHL